MSKLNSFSKHLLSILIRNIFNHQRSSTIHNSIRYLNPKLLYLFFVVVSSFDSKLSHWIRYDYFIVFLYKRLGYNRKVIGILFRILFNLISRILFFLITTIMIILFMPKLRIVRDIFKSWESRLPDLIPFQVNIFLLLL